MATRNQTDSRPTPMPAGELRAETGGAPTSAPARDAASARGESNASSTETERSIARSEDGGTARAQGMQPAARQQGSNRGAVARRSPRGGFLMTPWDLLQQMSREMEQLVRAVGAGAGAAPSVQRGGTTQAAQGAGLPAATTNGRAAVAPQIEVIHRPDALVVRADMPGLRADQIDVTAEDGMLVLSGERQEEHREQRDGVTHTEVTYGRFHRAIPLPDGADEDRITATYRNGVLEVVVPVAEREQARRVHVES